MSKAKAPVYLSNRSIIASFIGVSRMTLYRWERIYPLPKQGILNDHYIQHISDQEIIRWLRHLYGLLRQRARRQLKWGLKEELRNAVCSR